MNEVERIKQEKNPLDVMDDLRRYAVTGFDSIDPDDFVRMRWYGFYQQRPNVGHFMLRIKVPGGTLNSEQLRTVAHVSKTYGRGICDITTRQNFQFHWLEIQDLAHIADMFDSVGISTSGACGDIMRNITGCPVAGIDPSEIFDATPWVNSVNDYFHQNRLYSDLPRKYKLSISGCPLHCAQPEINDIGATAVTRKRADGKFDQGFQVRVGGGLSARPYLAKRLNAFIPPEKLISVMEVITILFRDFGNRENRKHARLKFLVDDWGIERFEAELRDRLDWTPDAGEDWPEPSRNFRDHIGVRPQKQADLHWIGAAVLTGRMSADQVFEAARIADEFGSGGVRTTNQQNLLFPGIHKDKVDAALAALDAAGLVVHASPLRRASIACTGNEFCNLALTETKILLRDIVEHLETTIAIGEEIRINLNGCPNSCGHHHIGDIGLQGCLVKQAPGKAVDGYDVFLGGRLGAEAKFVRPIWRKLPATKVKFALEHLLLSYVDQREDDDDFGSFVDRHSNDDLAAMMKTAFAESA
jgi:sulfite reductase beta subunit-like hemoprotein